MADIATTNTTQASTTTTNPVLSNEERISKINSMYDASLNSNKANLESAYQQNLSNMQADRANIGTGYEAQRNNLAAQYERQRRNNNMQAAANGLNTGAGSQMALAQSANYQSNIANLAKAQQQQMAEADRQITDLTTQYQIAVNDAISKNDQQRAAALLDEYNNQAAREDAKAKVLAQYGDFSGYESLYGKEQANNMALAWFAQNGVQNGDLAYKSGALDRAYNAGTITAQQYKDIHGSFPANSPEAQAASAPSGGGGYSYGGGGIVNYHLNDVLSGSLGNTASEINSNIKAGGNSLGNQALQKVVNSLNSGNIKVADSGKTYVPGGFMSGRT